jgi:protein phosphatase
MQKLVTCNIAALTDMGMVRTNNEDALIIADLNAGRPLPHFTQLTYPLDATSLLFVVSDGVGGQENGEIASQLTVLTIKDALIKLPKHISPYDRLVAAVEQANHLVWNEKIAKPELGNMCATATAVLVEGENVFIAEVGDSRAYLIRGNKIVQVTSDQTYVSHLILNGIIRPEQALQHPRKHMILQAIGGDEVIKVAVNMVQLRRADSLLLCSDGLYETVQDQEIADLVEELSPDRACRQLVDLAKERGGPDNITTILAHFDGEGLKTDQSPMKMLPKIEMLSRFNPEEKTEKSHMRTSLLGNVALSIDVNNVLTPQSAPQPQEVYSLSAFPDKMAIIEDCQSMLESLNNLQKLLAFKPDQIKQVAQWLEKIGCQFADLDQLLDHLQYTKEQTLYIEGILNYLLQIFDATEKIDEEVASEPQVVVMAKIYARPGMEEKVRFALSSLIGPTRKEKGCVSYYFYQSATDKCHFISYEIWETQEMFAKHLQTPYIIALQESGADMLARPLEIIFVEPMG